MKHASLPLRRRAFITLLGGAAAAAAWPLAARMHEGRLIQNMAGQIIARHSDSNPVATLLH